MQSYSSPPVEEQPPSPSTSLMLELAIFTEDDGKDTNLSKRKQVNTVVHWRAEEEGRCNQFKAEQQKGKWNQMKAEQQKRKQKNLAGNSLEEDFDLESSNPTWMSEEEPLKQKKDLGGNLMDSSEGLDLRDSRILRKMNRRWDRRVSMKKEPPPSPSSTENQNPNRIESFQVVHKVPTGASPYVKCKHVQWLKDREPSKANCHILQGPLEDMTIVMKQLDRTDEAIEAGKSSQHLCSLQCQQESHDNVLIDLYEESIMHNVEQQISSEKKKKLELHGELKQQQPRKGKGSLSWFLWLGIVLCVLVASAVLSCDNKPSFADMVKGPKSSRNTVPVLQNANAIQDNAGQGSRTSLKPLKLKLDPETPPLRYAVIAFQWTRGFYLKTPDGRDQINRGDLPMEDWMIHGLWPPSDLKHKEESFSRSKVRQDQMLLNMLKRKWLKLGHPAHDLTSHMEFWEYQWRKHGDQSGLDQIQFMRLAVHLHEQLKKPLKHLMEDAKTKSDPASYDSVLHTSTWTLKPLLFQQATQAALGGMPKLLWEQVGNKFILTEIQFNISLLEDGRVTDMVDNGGSVPDLTA